MVYSDGEIETFQGEHSPRYNQLKTHSAVRITHPNFLVSIISLNSELKIEKIPVYQNNCQQAFKDCKGVKLTLGDKVKEIYINRAEIVKNDKLLVGDNHHLFYGTVVVWDESNNRIRLK